MHANIYDSLNTWFGQFSLLVYFVVSVVIWRASNQDSFFPLMRVVLRRTAFALWASLVLLAYLAFVQELP
jgi:hypothetical protein